MFTINLKTKKLEKDDENTIFIKENDKWKKYILKYNGLTYLIYSDIDKNNELCINKEMNTDMYSFKDLEEKKEFIIDFSTKHETGLFTGNKHGVLFSESLNLDPNLTSYFFKKKENYCVTSSFLIPLIKKIQSETKCVEIHCEQKEFASEIIRALNRV